MVAGFWHISQRLTLRRRNRLPLELSLSLKIRVSGAANYVNRHGGRLRTRVGVKLWAVRAVDQALPRVPVVASLSDSLASSAAIGVRRHLRRWTANKKDGKLTSQNQEPYDALAGTSANSILTSVDEQEQKPFSFAPNRQCQNQDAGSGSLLEIHSLYSGRVDGTEQRQGGTVPLQNELER